MDFFFKQKLVTCQPMWQTRIIILVLCFSTQLQAQILPTFGNSRTGGSGMQFLKIPHDARSTSMAGAVVGITNDVSALFWNPAGITKVDTGKVNFQLSHTRYYANSSANFFGAVAKVRQHSYVGLTVQSLNYGEMEETTEWQPYGTGRNVNTSNVLVGLSYAQVLTDNFSFGVNGKWAHEGIADVRVNNVLFDLGLTYNIGLMNSKFGVVFSNFGLNVAPDGTVSILKLNGEQQVTNFSEVSVPSVFRIGGALDPIHTKLNVLTLSAQLNHPTDNNESFATGAEYGYKNILFARTGYEFGSDENYRFPTAGFGMRLQRRFGAFRFDYGFSNKSRLGNIHRLTLSICVR
ncbi:MAG: PorV/PorQ family protein [Bacteroidia bacterium]|nr:PorV/PorQ family protein [Bacteroidia bacterium]